MIGVPSTAVASHVITRAAEVAPMVTIAPRGCASYVDFDTEKTQIGSLYDEFCSTSILSEFSAYYNPDQYWWSFTDISDCTIMYDINMAEYSCISSYTSCFGADIASYETWGSQDVRACSYTWLTSAAGSHPATVDVIATAVSSPTSTAKNGAAQAVGVLKSGAVKIGTQPRATAVVILIGVLAMLVFQAAL